MAASGIDNLGVFYSDPLTENGLQRTDEMMNEGQKQDASITQVEKQFKSFLRNFHVVTQDGGVVYIYRDAIKQNYLKQKYVVDIHLGDLKNYDRVLWTKIKTEPRTFIDVFEKATTNIADEITRPRPAEQEDMVDMQVTLNDDEIPTHLRELKADHVARLVKIPGIIVNSSSVQTKARCVTLQCKSCGHLMPNISVPAGLDGMQLPKFCPVKNEGGKMGSDACQPDPFMIVPSHAKYIDFQTLKLQEAPDSVPQGEMPRHVRLWCERELVDKVTPGQNVNIIGIFCIKAQASAKASARSRDVQRGKAGVGIRQAYIRVLGIVNRTEVARGSAQLDDLTADEEQIFRELAAREDISTLLRNSIAPSVFGCDDIKMSIVALLLGGSRKRMPDGLTRRGDINVLLLGDPGTAKSQLLKFVQQVAPVCVYTSGKGSSAAGLTASVIRGQNKRFTVEAGAMVLADGGTVCIDEFDKMRQDDRVAIHEAMEQQTISVAKAGITTTLNSRCSVLAAANSVFGRWDDTKGEENIDFMPTILSRFDCIFIVKDVHDEQRDKTLARHVMAMHINSGMNSMAREKKNEELDITTLKRFICYCRSKCGPRLDRAACDKLSNRYCQMRSGAGDMERETGKRGTIPLTVRQLEAVVRIAESQAKMKLKPFAGEDEIDEALRLFQVSTLDAAMSGNLDGAEGFTSDKDFAELQRIEKQLKRRFLVHSQVSEATIIKDLCGSQHLSERQVKRVLQAMLQRGEVEHRMQRKMLFRVR